MMPYPLDMLVSIHDVCPASLPAVAYILKILEQNDISSVTLLVVPGENWSATDVKKISRLAADQRIQLAGHGWRHHCPRFASAFHRLHGLLISRDAAERLALPLPAIADRIQRAYECFLQMQLPVALIYVPPAWAMGPLKRGHLRHLPFRFYETFSGLYDARLDRFTRVFLNGWEADTWLRASVLRFFNWLNLKLALCRQRPLCVAVHPYDFEYRMARRLHRLFKQPLKCLHYHSLSMDSYAVHRIEKVRFFR